MLSIIVYSINQNQKTAEFRKIIVKRYLGVFDVVAEQIVLIVTKSHIKISLSIHTGKIFKVITRVLKSTSYSRVFLFSMVKNLYC